MNLSFLKRLDALGTVVGFRIDGHNRKRTVAGAIVTIFLLFICLSVLIFFFEMYFAQKETYQKSLVNTFDNGQELDLNESHFLYGLKFNTKNNQIYDEIYYIDVSWVKYDLTTKKMIMKEPLGQEKCDKKKWKGTSVEYDILGIDECMCFDNKKVTLYGNSHYGVISKLEISLVIKDEVLNDIDYVSRINELEKINPPTLDFYFYNTMFSSNHGHSITHFIDKYSYEVHIDTYIIADVYLSLDQMIEVHDKLLLTTQVVTSEYKTHKSKIVSKVRKNLDKNNILIDIIPDTKRNIIIYSSLTLSETLARTGGIINIMLLSGQVLIYMKNYVEYEYGILKKYFCKINDDIKIEYFQDKTWIPNENIEINKHLIEIKEKKMESQKSEGIEKSNSIMKSSDIDFSMVPYIENSLAKIRKENVEACEDDSQKVNFTKNNFKNENAVCSKILCNLDDIDDNTYKDKSLGYISEIKQKAKSLREFMNNAKNAKYAKVPKNIKNINFVEWLLFKYFSYFLPERFQGLHKKLYIFKQIDEYLNKALNVQDIEQRYMDIELLKLVLFDPQQYKAFQNISFNRGIQHIMENKKIRSSEENNDDEVNPQLIRSLDKLYERHNTIDEKIRKYY
jgi:hypothetical protein